MQNTKKNSRLGKSFSGDYEKQNKLLATVIESILNPEDKRTIADFSDQLKSCSQIYKKYPSLGKIIKKQLEVPSFRSFMSEFNNLSKNDMPEKIYTKTEVIERKLDHCSCWEKIQFVRTISQKFK